MREQLREPVFAGVLAIAIAIGLLIDVATGGVGEPPTTTSTPSDLAARAVFCPPTSGQSPNARTSVVSAAERALKVDAGGEMNDLAPDRALGINSDSAEPSEVVGYGGPVAAGTAVVTQDPVAGAGAMRCSQIASPTWFFAAGSASLGSRQRILLFNPFPDEAVVRVNFFTPEGRELRTTFEEVPVPAHSWEFVDINDAIRVTTTVAVVVNASRGRVVAWRELFADPDELPSGVQASTGAPSPGAEWFFPEGGMGPGVDERIALLNPTGREAEVAITLATSEETIQARRLMEIPVPRRSSISIQLEEQLRAPAEPTGISATVTSLNGVGIVAERIVWYDTGESTGVASEIGARRAAARWALPPAAIHPATDAVTVMNPGAEPVTFAVEFLRTNDDPIAPQDLQQIQLRPGARVKLPVADFTDGRAAPALITASGPVVAERFSYSNQGADFSSVIGVPIRPLP